MRALCIEDQRVSTLPPMGSASTGPDAARPAGLAQTSAGSRQLLIVHCRGEGSTPSRRSSIPAHHVSRHSRMRALSKTMAVRSATRDSNSGSGISASFCQVEESFLLMPCSDIVCGGFLVGTAQVPPNFGGLPAPAVPTFFGMALSNSPARRSAPAWRPRHVVMDEFDRPAVVH